MWLITNCDFNTGTFNYSLRFLTKTWGWKFAKVQRFLMKLERENMIKKRYSNRYSNRYTKNNTYHIVKYKTYQKRIRDDRYSNRYSNRYKEQQYTSINNNKNTSEYSSTFSDEFEKLWEKYPRKIGKKEAARYFRGTVKTDEDLAAINKALDNYLKSESVLKGNIKYIQHGKTWFNNWEDWVDYREEGKIEYDSPEAAQRARYGFVY